MATLFSSRKVPANAFWGGLLDYNDLATATTPITITGWAAAVPLTNDELWPFTNKAYKPVNVDDVWDTSNNRFDFSDLKLWDMIDIRLDVELTTTSVNTEIEIDLIMAEWTGWEYSIPFVTRQNFKTAWTYLINRFNGIYMWDLSTLNNFAKFKMSSDKTCTVKVNGWYCKVIQRAVV